MLSTIRQAKTDEPPSGYVHVHQEPSCRAPLASMLPASVSAVLRECRVLFKGVRSVGPDPRELTSLLTLFESLHREHFRFERVLERAQTDASAIRYVHVHQEPSFSAGVFVLPPGATIPLHDHPEMAVFSRLLHGSLKSVSYDLVPPRDLAEGAGELLRAHRCVLASTAAADGGGDGGADWVSSDAPCTLTLGPVLGNLHEFVAGPAGCVIFDVLAPPYSPATGRDCTYYRYRCLQSAPAELRELAAVHGALLLEAFEPPEHEFCVIGDCDDDDTASRM